jgi:nitric oxide reductase NorE protein
MNTQSITSSYHNIADVPQRQGREVLPGDFAIWIFIFAEMLAFGCLFVAYAFSRTSNVELFNESQLTLDRTAGALNTLVLITSSYFVMRAVTAIRQGFASSCTRWLSGALLLGAVFIVIKLVEYIDKFSEGISLSTNTFYMFYLSLTFFHFMHVLMGMVILGFVIAKARSGGYSRNDHVGVETGASFWHMVDLLWIILFPLIYIIH